MKYIFHQADSRHYNNLGWLQTYHTFSFSNYFDPKRVNFGALRVLNDDTLDPAKGFGQHPHDNMEIVSIPLEGALEHKDSQGNKTVVKKGEVQVMSAGTGIFHSEYNRYKDRTSKFLQIWIYPNKRDVTPRYQQISLEVDKTRNQWVQILSPYAEDAGVWIHQDAWFQLAKLDQGTQIDYAPKLAMNGVYVFVIEGQIEVNEKVLHRRDGYGIWETEKLHFQAQEDTYILLMDIPMTF